MPRQLKYNLPPLDIGQETIGQRIARIRKRIGLTQTELGEKIGITQTLVSDYEIGRAHLSDEMIIRFALVLKVSTDELLGLDKKNDHLPSPSLKLMKRLQEIDNLSPSEQKALLKNIDMFLKAAKKANKY